MNDTGLIPRWASAPGSTIVSALTERHISTADFASRVGLCVDDANHLFSGQLRITVALARRLSDVLGASTSFWLARDAQYLEDHARVEADRWSMELPLSQMADFGWIDLPATWQERIATSLGFFDVPDVETWQRRYDRQVEASHYRTSPSFALDPLPTTAWFRAAERVVDQRPRIPSFDVRSFATSLATVRPLTRERDPARFIPQLVQRTAACGVNVVVLPAPRGCPASGASRMYRDNPLIQLSGRFLTDDHFWFTFFHEAGHVVNHQLDAGFIDDLEDTAGDQLETEANDFAIECLLRTGASLKPTGRRWSHRDVVREALAREISPGVLVGHLQHIGALPPTHLNGLKRRYIWRGSRLAERPRV